MPQSAAAIYMKRKAGEETQGEILKVSHGDMQVRAPLRFAEGELLEFRVEDCVSRAQVLYCRPDGDQFFMALVTPAKERRTETRFAAHHSATISIISPDKPGTSRGRLADVSRSGIGVLLPSAIAPGTLVEVRSDGSVLFGEVRNCARVTGGYRIGILSEESFIGDFRQQYLSGGRFAFLESLRAKIALRWSFPIRNPKADAPDGGRD